MNDLHSPSQWIAACAVELAARWRTVPPALLEELAVDLWRDERLRILDPAAAARAWLAPVGAAWPHVSEAAGEPPATMQR
ncbi:hypothetical protein [Ramlibacter sp.]|uniref:hypothetical protein n=1 Tax=Ramlibacter sp. TaxID=1917967 RepID=UPI003D0FD64B